MPPLPLLASLGIASSASVASAAEAVVASAEATAKAVAAAAATQADLNARASLPLSAYALTHAQLLGGCLSSQGIDCLRSLASLSLESF